MDDCLAQVAIDFGGRNWLVWETEFKREMVGKMPTEMFFSLNRSQMVQSKHQHQSRRS
jgi:imidazoleglycerol-phosphate dehydratase/histidinol-phosphatase